MCFELMNEKIFMLIRGCDAQFTYQLRFHTLRPHSLKLGGGGARLSQKFQDNPFLMNI